MPALADAADHPDGPLRVRHEHVDQGRLADPGVPDQRGDLVAQHLPQLVGVLVGAGDHDRQVQLGVLGGERAGIGEVGLRQAQHRLEPAGVGGDEAAVDEAGPGDRVGERGDDHQLVGVRHDHPLVGVGVVRGAAQHAGALRDADDAGEGVVGAGDVADEVDVVADDDRDPAHLAGAHRDDAGLGLVVGGAGPAAAVDADDHRGARVGVLGAALRPRPGAPPGPDPDVALVVAPRRAPAGHAGIPAPCTSAGQSVAKSGRVLVVAVTSSISTPGTTRPTSAPAVAMRWSA